MAWKRKDETDEEARERHADYMRKWYAKKHAEILAAPKKMCACGCGDPVLSLHPEAKYARGHWTLGKEFRSTEKAALSPTLQDIAWAAGFLEGEGYFGATQGSNGYGVSRVSAVQQQKWPLEKLQKLFGGTISARPAYRSTKPYFRWYIHQARARGVMMTIYSFMSVRRQEQIRDVLSKWSRNGHATARDRRGVKYRDNYGS